MARDYSPRDYGASKPGRNGGNLSEVRRNHREILSRVVSGIRTRHYSIRTEQAYEGWICRFIAFHGGQSPDRMGATAVAAFLEHLAVQGKVAASTQSQALCALVFLYDKVLEQPLGDLGKIARAKRPRRLPVVEKSGVSSRIITFSKRGIHLSAVGTIYVDVDPITKTCF